MREAQAYIQQQQQKTNLSSIAADTRKSTKQAEFVSRNTEQIKKLKFQIEQATADIAAEQNRLSQLFALLDIAEAQQASVIPGSKADEQAQRKIISIENQIYSAEKRIRSAEFKKRTAEQKLNAA